MEDPYIRRAEESYIEVQSERESAARQRAWLRRMLFLLVFSCVVFGLLALWFSHLSNSVSLQKADSEATKVVREHFAALERGDYRAAYEQFSPRYRRQIPFPMFVQMVVGHWQMLQGQATVFPQSATPNRVIVHVEFAGTRDVSLTAEFTLVRDNGRWWIDNVDWERKRTPHMILT